MTIINMSSSTPLEHGQVSIEEAFASLFQDEAFHDVELEGDDGVRIPVNRTAMAARSQFFRTLLLGDFSERTDAVVKVGCTGEILKSVVQYIHTNRSDLLVEILPTKQDDLFEAESTVAALQSVLSLEEAATYFNLPGLVGKTRQCITKALQTSPALAFVVVEFCHGSATGGVALEAETRDLAMSTIQSHAKYLLKSSAVEMLSSSTVEAILQNGTLRMRDDEIFGFLCHWAKEIPDSSSAQDHKSTATSLVAKHVQLENIDPQILSTTVASSGLVTAEKLAEAFKTQALDAKREHGFPFKKPRPVPVWKDSKSDCLPSNDTCSHDVSDVVKWTPLTSGIYQWTIVVEETTSMGNICSEISRDKIWLGVIQPTKNNVSYVNPRFPEQTDTWGFMDNGEFYNAGICFRTFGFNQANFNPANFRNAGSKVTMSLNLSSMDKNNGSLSISVNGKQSLLGTGNLCSHLSKGGFVPAAWVPGGAKVRIVDFQNIEGQQRNG